MNIKLNKYQIERFSRQIILKDVGVLGQKKIIKAKVLIVGMGGLGCPAAEFLTRAGVGSLGIIDPDEVDLSNIHRQSLFNSKDLKKLKVLAAKKKLKKINPKTEINCYRIKLNEKNSLNIIKKYDFIIDGSDNFETKFLINDFCKKFKKFLVTGAISKFDGHIFTFNFKKKGTPCIRNFFQEEKVFDNTLNCEYEGVLGTVAGIVGIFQANEILKRILSIGKDLNGYILILDLLNLNFRKVKLNKFKNV
jgi:molybdopterin/thiamine biosynthesis adenylyltransferase